MALYEPSDHPCPECGSTDMYQEPTSDSFACKACGHETTEEEVLESETEQIDESRWRSLR